MGSIIHKKDLDLTILELLKQGKNPSTISKELNISKQKINYHTTRLKKKGFLEKKGYGTWEVKKLTSSTLPKKDRRIRGHAFIWNIKTNKKIDWKKRFESSKIDYKLVRGYTPRTFIGKKKVWFGKKSIVIYEPFSFYGLNAVESKKYAVISLLETLREIERIFKVNLKPYYFKVSREHYAMIKNELARQVNREGDKIRIADENGDWMWIDMSDGIGELETGNYKALENNLGVQNWYNSMKKHKFKVTPDFILTALEKVASNQIKGELQVQQFTEQIKVHLKLIKEYRSENKKWRKNLEKKYKTNIEKEQRKLGEFFTLL